MLSVTHRIPNTNQHTQFCSWSRAGSPGTGSSPIEHVYFAGASNESLGSLEFAGGEPDIQLSVAKVS